MSFLLKLVNCILNSQPRSRTKYSQIDVQSYTYLPSGCQGSELTKNIDSLQNNTKQHKWCDQVQGN